MSQVVRVECQDADIDWRVGQWVKFTRRMPGDRFLQFLALTAELEEIQADAQDITTAKDIKENSERLENTLARIHPILAQQIVAWNWRDLDGADDEQDIETLPIMPKPTQETIANLSMLDEVIWLISALSGVVFPEKN